MKKHLIISLCGFMLCSFLFAGLSGDKYTDDKYGFEISLPSSWLIDTKQTKKRVIFGKNDGISEVYVEVLPLAGNQREAIDVAKAQNIAYDGWQYIAGRHAEWNEKHGAENGFLVMYTKIMIRRSTNNNKVIVQEGYFIKNRTAYMITLISDSDHWDNAKDGLMFAWNSFYIK